MAPVNQQTTRWWAPVLRGALLIILGIFCFVYPLTTLVAAGIYIGLLLVVTGALLGMHALSHRQTMPGWGVFLAGGIFEVVLGVLLLLSPAVTAVSLPFALGFWAIIIGITQTINAIDLRVAASKNWGLNLASGIAGIILGCLIFASPVFGIVATTTLMGTAMLLLGAGAVYVGMLMRRMRRGLPGISEMPSERRADQDRAA